MAKKRGNGEGTLYQRKNGSWCSQATVGGKRITVYGKTKTETRTKLREKLDSIAINGCPLIKSKNITIGEAIQLFQSQSTIANKRTCYAYKMRLGIINKYIGNKPVKIIDTNLVENLVNRMIIDNYSRNTINVVIYQLKNLFNFLKENKYIDRNKIIETVKINKKTPKFILPPLEEVIKVIQRIKSVPIKYLALFCIYTGLRRGELCGLQWGDISESGVISVMREYVGFTRNSCVMSVPKNGIVGQKVQIPKEGMIILEELKSYYKKNNINSGFVFCKDSGEPLLPVSVTICLGRNIKKIAPRGAVHILRHLHATFLAVNGVSIRSISKQLRHSSISTTDKYINELMGEDFEDIKNIKMGCSNIAVNKIKP